jgi:transposase-like protein
MFFKVYVCPHCQRPEGVVRHGFTRAGSQRLRCNACQRAWAPEGKSRKLSREKEALIEKALGERLSQRAIARSLGCGRDTVARVLKKSRVRRG